jgi:hypothetical protein
VLGTEYHFKVKAFDKAGNAATSDDTVFKTKFAAEALEDLATIEHTEQFEERLGELIQSALPSLSPPVIADVAVSDITETGATIFWRTNVRSSTAVALAARGDYKPGASNPYAVEIGGEGNTTEHRVLLTNLTPNTEYHFSPISKSLASVAGRGPDRVFITKAAKIQALISEVTTSSFAVVWSTEEPASSIVRYSNTATGETNEIMDERKTALHRVVAENLPSGARFTVKVSGYNEKGNLLEGLQELSVITRTDTTAPSITSFKVSNSFAPGRSDRIQSVFSWTTDEPATSLVEYGEGLSEFESGLPNSAGDAASYVQNHTVIVSTLKPGTIYQIKIISTDTAGNRAEFGPRTIITPRQDESITDIIFKNFEDTFKFMRNIRF